MNNKNGSGNDNDNNSALSATEEIDWSAMMRHAAPPEWDMLLSAAAKNQLDQVRYLVERIHVPVTHSNGIGQTALHVAVMWGHIHVARYLLEKGANANAANQLMGATPLHTVMHSHRITAEQQVALVNLLLEPPGGSTPSDPQVEDKFGKCAVEYMEADHPHGALLKVRLAPPPRTMERLRAGFLNSAFSDMPTCYKAT